ncbi:MAG: TRAP transporter small permease subunit [Pelagibacteraceae bacterium]|jgi:TRAP-type mannitol/chloroaromatic compound transport system permease small subunit
MFSYIKFADQLSISVGKTFAWCIFILTFGTVYECIVAYVFNAPTLWNFDFSIEMYGALFIMAGAYAVATQSHVRGDVFYRLMKPSTQAKIDFVLYFLFYFPGVLALAYKGIEYAGEAWHAKETSWNSPAQIQIYMFKTLIPVAGVLLVLQGIAELLRCIVTMQTNKWPPREDDVEETEKKLIKKKDIDGVVSNINGVLPKKNKKK